MRKMKPFICAAVCAAMLIMLAAGASADSSVWSGGTQQPSKMVSVDNVYYYEISTAEELAYLAENSAEWGGYNYRLANDIVLNDAVLSCDANGNLTADTSTLKKWTPIANFTGIFDGNGHSISGLYVNGGDYVGLFGECRGNVYHLTITNSYIKGGEYVGGICGRFCETGAEMRDCFFDGAVVGTTNVGGLIGGNQTSYIYDCGNYGDVWGTGDYVSGVVGGFYAYGIERCFNEGNICSTGNYVAGIAGSSDIYSIADCVNRGSVTGNDYVGGICGMIEDAGLYRCGNLGTVTGNTYVGGICGYSIYGHVTSWVSYITDSYNTAAVSGSSYVGGITGYVEYAELTNCQNIGNVSGGSLVGGIVGNSESIWGKGTVTNCHYLKDHSVNVALNGFGNVEDVDGVVNGEKMDFFCIGEDGVVHVSGHTYNGENACMAQCAVCGAKETGDHVYDQLKCSDEGHWYECGCGAVDPAGVQAHCGGFAACGQQAACEVCGQYYGAIGEHIYDESGWDYCDETGHGRYCTWCWELRMDPHNFADSGDGEQTCVDCGYVITLAEHSHVAGEWGTSSRYHWQVCLICGEKLDKEKHTDKNEDGACDVCGAELEEDTDGEEKSGGISVGVAAVISFAGGAAVGVGGTVAVNILIRKKKSGVGSKE